MRSNTGKRLPWLRVMAEALARNDATCVPLILAVVYNVMPDEDTFLHCFHFRRSSLISSPSACLRRVSTVIQSNWMLDIATAVKDDVSLNRVVSIAAAVVFVAISCRCRR